MAGQTEASDDLIAELAKLMADGARAESQQRNDVAPLRIPGHDDTPLAPPAPAPAPARNEPSFSEAPRAPAPQQNTVRIPGTQAPQAASPDPFQFNFDIGGNARTPVAASPAPAPFVELAQAPAPVQAPPANRPPANAPDLDHDSLADLIAAELANDAPSLAPQFDRDMGTGSDEQDDHPETLNSDIFNIPPVFGLASTAAKPVAEPVAPVMPVTQTYAPVEPPAPQPRPVPPDPDPLDEIERLIGPAVRLEPKQPAPALRSLATPTLPTPQPKANPDLSSLTSVDDAILAAAAATGARVEWVDPTRGNTAPPVDDEFEAPVRDKRVLGMARAVAGPVIALTLLVTAGLGLFWVLGNGEATPDTAPLLVADTAEVKEVPEVDPAASTTQQSVVFNEIAGTDNGAVEQIVSRDQAIPEVVSPPPAADVDQDGLVNRKVRTVTVRPDGTIVSSDSGLAGASMLPVDRPDVPEVPGADFSTPDMLANTAPAATATETPAAVEPTVVPVQPGSTVNVVDQAGNVIPGRTAIVPMARPANLDAMIEERLANAPAEPVAFATSPITTSGGAGNLPPPPSNNLLSVTAPAPAVAATPVSAPVQQQPVQQQPAVAAAPASSAPAYIQLASQRSEEAARQTAASLEARFGSLFGGAPAEVRRVDLGERGIYYRVLVPADSLQGANAICSNIKSAGGDCFAM